MSEIRTEHTFDVDVTPDEVWKALRATSDEHRSDDAADGAWWLPGWTSRCTLLSESDDAIELRKDDEPCAGTSIVVEIAHLDSGSTIRIVQSGFDPSFVAGAGESFWTHAARIAADFEVFVRHGVVADRAWRWPAVDLGFGSHTAGAAVVVDAIRADSWASAVGLQGGDLVLTLAGASVYNTSDLLVAHQTVDVGDDVSVTFVRAETLHRAAAAV